jgi:hypothetical protein
MEPPHAANLRELGPLIPTSAGQDGMLSSLRNARRRIDWAAANLSESHGLPTGACLAGLSGCKL